VNLISDYAEQNQKRYKQQLILGYGGLKDASIRSDIKNLMNKFIQKKET